jgi:hypothetical protein
MHADKKAETTMPSNTIVSQRRPPHLSSKVNAAQAPQRPTNAHTGTIDIPGTSHEPVQPSPMATAAPKAAPPEPPG